jgi:hypothetical protein
MKQGIDASCIPDPTKNLNREYSENLGIARVCNKTIGHVDYSKYRIDQFNVNDTCPNSRKGYIPSP